MTCTEWPPETRSPSGDVHWTAAGTPPFPSELGALEHILLGDLRELLESPFHDRTRQWLETILDMLLEMLPGQFAAEESGGYMADVLHAFPQWHERVDALYRQHSDLYRNLAELRVALTDKDLTPSSAGKVRQALRNWMEGFQNHQEAEFRLMKFSAAQPTLAT